MQPAGRRDVPALVHRRSWRSAGCGRILRRTLGVFRRFSNSASVSCGWLPACKDFDPRSVAIESVGTRTGRCWGDIPHTWASPMPLPPVGANPRCAWSIVRRRPFSVCDRSGSISTDSCAGPMASTCGSAAVRVIACCFPGLWTIWWPVACRIRWAWRKTWSRNAAGGSRCARGAGQEGGSGRGHLLQSGGAARFSP